MKKHMPDTEKIEPRFMPANDVSMSNFESTTIFPTSFARELSEIPPSEHKCYECCRSCCGNCLGCMGASCCCCSDCSPYKIVPQGTAGIQTKFGKAYRIVDPGIYFVNSLCENMYTVDIKMNISDVPKQTVMTKDNVVINIDPVVYWHIIDPFVAKFQVANVTSALTKRTMSTLRDTIGAHTLQEIIEDRQTMAKDIKEIIEKVADSWGIVIEAILISDMRFSQDLQENLSAAVKQQRIGQSKVIAAKAEVQASKLLREASEILNTPAAVQIRHLDTMSSMAKNPGTKVVFTLDEAKGFK